VKVLTVILAALVLAPTAWAHPDPSLRGLEGAVNRLERQNERQNERLRIHASFIRWNDLLNSRQERKLERLLGDVVALQSQIDEAIHLAYYVLPRCMAKRDRYEDDCLERYEIDFEYPATVRTRLGHSAPMWQGER
jgi:hypothetical protein